MRALRPYLASALVIIISPVWGCGAVDDEGLERGDREPDLDVVLQNIDPLVGSCTFVKGVVTVTSTSTQTITVGKRAVDSVILINGDTCPSAAPVVLADSTKMKRLVVKGSAADESLILAFGGGFFAPGVATVEAGGIAVDLGGGNDVVTVQGTASADTILIGADGLAFNSDRYRDISFANVESLAIVLGGGADVLTATNALPAGAVTGASRWPLTVFGGDGNDVIVGGGVVDTIRGGGGNDILSGGAGNDLLYGEDGADIVQGTAAADGDDTIDCGDESPSNTSLDVVSYDKRTHAITATMGAPGTAGESGESDSIAANCEGITGGAGNDTLTGDANNNTLSGGAGDDTLTGKAGNDMLNGGDGSDTFDEEAAATGGDVISGGPGTDLVDYGDRTTNLTISMDGAAADDGASGELDNIRADVENILCGTGNDTVTGNTLANGITGGAGDDKLNGGVGNDVFNEEGAATGADTIAGGAGIDLVDYSGRSTDLTVTMDDELANDGAANEHDSIGSDVENLKAGSGNDSLTGNALANSIEGGAGNDTLVGGEGDDTLDGTDRASTNTIRCGGGADIALNAGAGSYASDCEIRGI